MLFIIFIAGLFLRTYNLSMKSFWTDELLSIWHSKEIVDLIKLFSPLQGNAHPPLFFLLLKLWSYGGNDESYLRLLPVIFGILAIPSTYILSRQFFAKNVSILSSFFIAISPYLILYDRELRMYSLLTLLTVISSYFFFRAVENNKGRYWIGYALFTVLNTYTHYHAFLVIMFQGVYILLWFKEYRNSIKPLFISLFITVLCFSFWVPSFLYHLRNFSALGGETTRIPISFGALVKPLYLFFSISIGQTVLPWKYLIVIPALILFPIMFVLGLKNLLGEKKILYFFLSAIFCPIILGILFSDLVPRYFVFIAPFFYIIISKGIFSFPIKKVQFAIIGIIVLLWCYPIYNYYNNKEFHNMATIDPWREVGKYLKENVKKNDLFFNIGGVPINYYTGFEEPVLGTNSLATIVNQLQLKEKSPKRIWVVVSNPLYKNDIEDVLQWMNDHYKLSTEKHYVFDPDYPKKIKLFKKDFLGYRIIIYLFESNIP